METGSGTARHLTWAHEAARRSRTVTVAHQIPTFPASVQACVTVLITVLVTDWWAKICSWPRLLCHWNYILCTVTPIALPCRPHSESASPRHRRFLPAPSKSRERLRSELAGDGELRRNLRPALRLRQVREPAPRGARPRPPPLRLPPCAWLVGPLQGRKLRIASSPRDVCAERIFDSFRGVFFSTQLPLERAATAVWEFSCVVPSQHGKSVDFILEFDNFAGPQRSLVPP